MNKTSTYMFPMRSKNLIVLTLLSAFAIYQGGPTTHSMRTPDGRRYSDNYGPGCNMVQPAEEKREAVWR